METGLRDKVVIVTGDFGRTPKINKNGGRDHWATLSTLAFFGGGLKTGQVIGKSARNNDVPASDPIPKPWRFPFQRTPGHRRKTR